MLRLIELDAWDSKITDLTGLEHATFLRDLGLCVNQIRDLSPLAGLVHLEHLSLCVNQISDISPLANLINLKSLDLGANWKISDITPLANLTQLEKINLGANSIEDITPLANLTRLIFLRLDNNHIADFSPLANLVNLQKLWINENPGTDFTPLLSLNLTSFRYDEVCEIPPLLPPVRERIESRNSPSVFQAWNDVVGLDHLTWEQRNVLHDLHMGTTFDDAIDWYLTTTEPTYGVAISLAGDLARAHQIRQRRLDQNPNMVFLHDVLIQIHSKEAAFPPGSDFWVRDENNQILRTQHGFYINFLKPEVQDLLIKRIIAHERCGLYDGVIIDGFGADGTSFSGRTHYKVTDEEISQAMLNIFRSVRAQTRDDFLILVNGNVYTQPRFAEFINGTFMETFKDHPGGYTPSLLMQLENTLLWSEENLREPQINCLEGEGMGIEPPDGPNNLRWMRLFTTLSLTHSDGYVLYTTGFRDLGGAHHDHLWHDFWDVDLGRPVGPKAQLYQNTPGTFIREFTNGWAVYNRSGKAQTIILPCICYPRLR